MTKFTQEHIENLKIFSKEIINFKHRLEIIDVETLVDFPLDEVSIDYFSNFDEDGDENRVLLDLNNLNEIIHSLLLDLNPERLAKLEHRLNLISNDSRNQ